MTSTSDPASCNSFNYVRSAASFLRQAPIAGLRSGGQIDFACTSERSQITNVHSAIGYPFGRRRNAMRQKRFPASGSRLPAEPTIRRGIVGSDNGKTQILGYLVDSVLANNGNPAGGGKEWISVHLGHRHGLRHRNSGYTTLAKPISPLRKADMANTFSTVATSTRRGEGGRCQPDRHPCLLRRRRWSSSRRPNWRLLQR